jgi:Predicted dehydrogenases and related proteins
MDLGVHCIDLIQYITGSKAVKVAGITGTKIFKYEVDDSASLIFETDKGANAYVDVNFNIPDTVAKCRLEFYGTKGSMLAEGTISQVEGGKLEVSISEKAGGYDAKQDRSDTAPLEIKAEFGNMYTKQIESFSNSVLNKCKAVASFEDTLNVQRVVEAAYESSISGKFIFV